MNSARSATRPLWKNKPPGRDDSEEKIEDKIADIRADAEKRISEAKEKLADVQAEAETAIVEAAYQAADYVKKYGEE